MGAVLATQHRRSAAALAIPAMGFPDWAGGTTWDRLGSTSPCDTGTTGRLPSPRRGTRTSPSWPWRREGVPGGSPLPGTATPTPFSAFSPFPPPIWHLAAEPWRRLGRAVPGKGCQASAAPHGPPAPRAKAGGWQKGCLRLAGLRQLREDPCAALTANFPASWHRRRLRRHRQRRLGRMDCERERREKKKNNGHMPSLER